MAKFRKGLLGERIRYRKPAISRALLSELRAPWPVWGKRLIRTLEVFVVIFAFLGLFTFFGELKERQEARINAAWQLVTTQASGNSGKGPALEFLNSQDEWFYGYEGWCYQWCPEWMRSGFKALLPIKERSPLIGIDLSAEDERSKVYLSGIELPGAELYAAKLQWSDLDNANLANADLWDADLTNADFASANLHKANLASANLPNAALLDANLTNATLPQANLANAALPDADLTQTNLFKANFFQTNLTKANLSYANVSHFNLKKAIGLNTINCEGSYYWHDKLFGEDMLPTGDFPCKPYGREEPDPYYPKFTRIYLKRPQAEDSALE